MPQATFFTPNGRPIPAVSAAEMREIDRVAVDEVGLTLLMMMEHAGRGLANTVNAAVPDGPVTVLAGGGGNGGGGLCAARHLANHGRPVSVLLDREAAELSGATAQQWRVLGPTVDRSPPADDAIAEARGIVDALVGYSLEGPPRGRVGSLVELAGESAARVISLDVPTGVDATTGERPGAAVEPDVTVTLALPKHGLAGVNGTVWLADIGIPGQVYQRTGIDYVSPFERHRWRLPITTGRPDGPAG